MDIKEVYYHFIVAKKLYEDEDWLHCLELLDEIIESISEWSDAHYMRAEVLRHLGDYYGSLVSCRIAINFYHRENRLHNEKVALLFEKEVFDLYERKRSTQLNIE